MMPCGNHQVDVAMPIEAIWNFVSDVNNWAPLIPGYIKHDIKNKQQTTWTLRGAVGRIQKTIHVQMDIIEQKKPTRMIFKLSCENENVVGDGRFEAKTLTNHKTKIAGKLNIHANGVTGPMINAILRTILPKTTKQFTEAVVQQMLKTTSVTTG